MATDGVMMLERLSNAIATAVNPAVKTMTKDEYITYANEQVVALVKDPPDVAKARLSALEAANTEAKKFLSETTVKIQIFDPAQHTAEHSETMVDPVKSNDRKDEAPKTGEGEQAVKGKTSTAKSGIAGVLGELGQILNPQQGKAEGAAGGAAADEEEEEEDEEKKPAGGGGGYFGKGRDNEVEKSEDPWIEVNTKNENELFPLNMNEHKTHKGKIVRKPLTWGDDPDTVRGGS